MKRFEFKLDSLGRFKKWQKQQVETKFTQVCRELAVQQEQLQSLANELRQLFQPATPLADVPSLKQRLAEADYSKRIRDDIARQEAIVNKLQNEHAQLHDQYRRISTEVETLEKLRAQQLAEHQSRQTKQRQQELNDHITQAWFNAEGEDPR